VWNHFGRRRSTREPIANGLRCRSDARLLASHSNDHSTRERSFVRLMARRGSKRLRSCNARRHRAGRGHDRCTFAQGRWHWKRRAPISPASEFRCRRSRRTLRRPAATWPDLLHTWPDLAAFGVGRRRGRRFRGFVKKRWTGRDRRRLALGGLRSAARCGSRRLRHYEHSDDGDTSKRSSHGQRISVESLRQRRRRAQGWRRGRSSDPVGWSSAIPHELLPGPRPGNPA